MVPYNGVKKWLRWWERPPIAPENLALIRDTSDSDVDANATPYEIEGHMTRNATNALRWSDHDICSNRRNFGSAATKRFPIALEQAFLCVEQNQTPRSLCIMHGLRVCPAKLAPDSSLRSFLVVAKTLVLSGFKRSDNDWFAMKTVSIICSRFAVDPANKDQLST